MHAYCEYNAWLLLKRTTMKQEPKDIYIALNTFGYAMQ